MEEKIANFFGRGLTPEEKNFVRKYGLRVRPSGGLNEQIGWQIAQGLGEQQKNYARALITLHRWSSGLNELLPRLKRNKTRAATVGTLGLLAAACASEPIPVEVREFTPPQDESPTPEAEATILLPTPDLDLPETGKEAVDGYLSFYLLQAKSLKIDLKIPGEAKEILYESEREALDDALIDIHFLLSAAEADQKMGGSLRVTINRDGEIWSYYELEGMGYAYEFIYSEKDPNAIIGVRLVEMPLLPISGEEFTPTPEEPTPEPTEEAEKEEETAPAEEVEEEEEEVSTPEAPASLEEIVAELREELNLTVPEEFLNVEEVEYNVAPNASYQFKTKKIIGLHNGFTFVVSGRLESLLGYDKNDNLLILVRTSSEKGRLLKYYPGIESFYGPNNEDTHVEYTVMGDSLVVVAITPNTKLTTRDKKLEPTPVPRGTVFQFLEKLKRGLPLSCTSWCSQETHQGIVVALGHFFSQGNQGGRIIRESGGEPLVIRYASEYEGKVRLPAEVWPLE